MSLAVHLPLLLILHSELMARWSLLVSLKSKTTCIVLKGLHCAWMCSTPEANVNKVARLVSSSGVVVCKPPRSYSNPQYLTVFSICKSAQAQNIINVKADQCGRREGGTFCPGTVQNSLKAAKIRLL